MDMPLVPRDRVADSMPGRLFLVQAAGEKCADQQMRADESVWLGSLHFSWRGESMVTSCLHMGQLTER